MPKLPQRRRPRTPGEIITLEFLEPMGRTQQELADALQMERAGLNHLINGQRAVTVESALRLEKVLGPSALFWLNLQLRLDVWHALRNQHVRNATDTLEPLTQGSRKRHQFNRGSKFRYRTNPYNVAPE